VIDLRSRNNYHQAHIKDSISLPLDLCDEDFFINWDPAKVQGTILKNKIKVNAFKDRKRKFIYLIAG
jgi:hypothetical protein